ncbi:ubiquinone biosynthesis protein COQ7-domain-containing protein [Gigaspora rosea]|uniref:Ubiquinone biosynthesis protein COQ7-domain-containing protein n=1 Tax=Gigaspora rosea TaxID=44941 RepID=A0A397UWT3_9GLOM|nr:ubiquinone biosynthesis protein COQ7-domain-containing protein [Gigaspora rosea]
MTFLRQFSRSICANLFFVNINLNNGRFRSLGYQFVCLQNQCTIKSTTKNDRLTDEQKKLIDSMIRVDQAGEIGANWIYKDQMTVLGGDKKVGPVIQEMWEQKKYHLCTFDEMIPRHRVRPSLLRPVWEATGFILGVSTALIDKEFHDDELHYLDTAVDYESQKAPFYSLLSTIINNGCKAAIWVAKRI